MSKYFSFSELTRSNTAFILGIKNKPNEQETRNLEELSVMILDTIREKWGSPIIVSSGYRCKELNKAVNGSKTSQHMKGEAADIIARNGMNKDLFNMIEQMINDEQIEVGQLIEEKNYSWIHISLPTTKHRNEIKHM